MPSATAVELPRLLAAKLSLPPSTPGGLRRFAQPQVLSPVAGGGGQPSDAQTEQHVSGLLPQMLSTMDDNGVWLL